MKYIILLFTLLLSLSFTACEDSSLFSPSKEEFALKDKELNAKIILNKEQLANEKEISLAKINSEIEKEKLSIKKVELASKNIQVENEYKILTLKNQNDIEIKKLILIFCSLITIIISFALFVYFNNKRKDKLRAYEDNLEKYFKAKEIQARLDITNKVLDTISNVNLSTKEKNILISNISSTDEIIQEIVDIQLPTKDEEIVQLEVIEKKKKKKKKI